MCEGGAGVRDGGEQGREGRRERVCSRRGREEVRENREEEGRRVGAGKERREVYIFLAPVRRIMLFACGAVQEKRQRIFDVLEMRELRRCPVDRG
jgi:hypothetical protein